MHLFTNAFVIIASVFATTSSESCTNFAKKSEFWNKELTVQTIVMHYDCPSNYNCALKCMSRHGCLSMSYHRKEQTCLLHRVNSLSVSTEDFLTVPGSAYSDLEDWPLSQHPCRYNTCGDDEQCVPNGKLFLCMNTDTESCPENRFKVNCYKRYPNNLPDHDLLNVRYVKATVEDCLRFCNIDYPTFTSIQYTADQSCWCKRIFVWAYLKAGNTLSKQPGAYIYEKLW